MKRLNTLFCIHPQLGWGIAVFVFQYRWGDESPSSDNRRKKPPASDAGSKKITPPTDVPYSEPGRTASAKSEKPANMPQEEPAPKKEKSPQEDSAPKRTSSGPAFFDNISRGIGNAWRGFERIPKDANISATLSNPTLMSTPVLSVRSEYFDPLRALHDPKGAISPDLHEGYRFKIAVPAIRLGSSIFGNTLLLKNAAQFADFADYYPTAEEQGVWGAAARDQVYSGPNSVNHGALTEQKAREFARAAVSEQFKNAPYKDKFGPHLGEALENIFMADYFSNAANVARELGDGKALELAQQGQRRAGAMLIGAGLNFLTPTKKDAGAATYWLQSGMSSLLASSGVAGLSGELLIGGKKDRGYLDFDAKIALSPSATIPLTNFQLALNNTLLGMVEGAYYYHLSEGKNSKVTMKVGVSAGLLFPMGNSQILVSRYEREGRSFGLQAQGLQGTTFVGNLDLGVGGTLFAGKTSSLLFDAKVGLPPALVARMAGGAISDVLKGRSGQYYENWVPPVGYDVAYRTQLSKAVQDSFFQLGATGVVALPGATVDRLYAKIGYEGRSGGRKRVPIIGTVNFPQGELSESLVIEARGSPIKGLNLQSPLDNRLFMGAMIDYAMDSGIRVFAEGGAEAMKWGENPVPTINVGIGINLSPRSQKANAVNPREF